MELDVGVQPGEVDWEQPVDLRWDPYDYTHHSGAHPVWKVMRDEAPLYRNDEYDFWALSRFQDVLETYVDWQTYSSARGDILELIRGDRVNTYTLANMIAEDPPIQQLHRALVSRAFTPRAVKTIEDMVRTVTIDTLDEQIGGDGFDMVRDLGCRVSGSAIAGMLGVPSSDLPMILAMTDAQLHQHEELAYNDRSSFDRAASGKYEYYLEQTKLRRENPTHDIMSELATLEFTDEHGVTRQLTDLEVVGTTTLLTGGGYETVARFAGWAGAILAEFPDQRAKLVDRPELITNAIDELLRYEAPSHANARVSTEDVTWYGKEVPAGSVFLILPGSAGRDERHYPDPDVFDVERDIDRHLAFGFGTHYCLGAALARMEGRIILEEVLKRFSEWEVDWPNIEYTHAGSAVRGYAKLPIKL